MIDRVLLICDKTTSDVSYIRHGLENDEPNWRLVGPIAYTTREEAEAAIKNPKFLPHGLKGSFSILEVETSSFIQAVYNGFPPTHTDVFMIDQVLLPLTSPGARWIDDALGSPIWEPLFDEDGEGAGLEWLDRVLELVAAQLQMSMETIQAIGILNAADEDAATIEQSHSIIQQHVRVTITPEPGSVTLDHGAKGSLILTAGSRFWLHTTGLKKLGLPELEMRNVPGWWVTAAGEELLQWAVCHLENPIEDGHVLHGGGPVRVDIRASKSTDSHWKNIATTCLRLEVCQLTYTPSSKAGNVLVPSSDRIMH